MLNVRFAPKATELLRRREMTQRANRRHSVRASVAALLRCQLGQQCIGFLQIERIEPFGEPAVDWSEQVARLGLPTLIVLVSRKTRFFRRRSVPPRSNLII